MKNRKKPIRSAKDLKAFRVAVVCLIFGAFFVIPAAAAGSPTDVLTNFLNLLFALVRIVGVIAALWGLVNFAIALKSHDASQRTQGIVTFAVGLLIFFAKEILSLIGVTV